MNVEETGRVLGKCASYDRRKEGDAQTIAWFQAIGDLSYEDCIAAVIAHYTETAEWIMPAHVRTRVKAMRRDRLAREIIPAPPHELADNPRNHQAALQARIREIADGRSFQNAIGGPVREDDPPPTWAEARAAMKIAPTLTPQEKALRQADESRAAREAEAAGEDDAA